jgi:hypothetical protein
MERGHFANPKSVIVSKAGGINHTYYQNTSFYLGIGSEFKRGTSGEDEKKIETLNICSHAEVHINSKC